MSKEDGPPKGVPRYRSILPSMPSEEDSDQDTTSQPVAPHVVRPTGRPAYEHMLSGGYGPGQHMHNSFSSPTSASGSYSTVLPPFDAPAQSLMSSAEIPSPQNAGAYSPLTTCSGTYPPMPPPYDTSSVTPSYPGYHGSYPPNSYNHGAGIGGHQGYSYESGPAPYGGGYLAGYNTAPQGSGYGAPGMGSYPAYGAGYPGHPGGGEYRQPALGAYSVARRGRGTHLGPPRSFAKNPGRPIVNNSDNRENPEGVTLFVFYIPNDMTNHDLHELFKPHGNILSVSIKTEEDTGRGRGYGFVSFEKAESAASAIQHLNGYQIHGKRLKVDYKKSKQEEKSLHDYRHMSPHSGLLPPYQGDYPSRPISEPRQFNYRRPSETGFVPIQDSGEGGDIDAGSFLPVQEARPPQSRKSDGYMGVLPPLGGLKVEEDDDDDNANSYEGDYEDRQSSEGHFTDLSDIGVSLPNIPNKKYPDVEPVEEYDTAPSDEYGTEPVEENAPGSEPVEEYD